MHREIERNGCQRHELRRESVCGCGQPSAAPGSDTILLVEDEGAVRALAARVLRRKGFTVLEAKDGEDALRVAGSHAGAITLLITDLIMPGLDGPRLAERLLASGRPAMRVLLISGYMEEDLRRGALRHAAFLGKPFLPDDLVARVETLLAAPAADTHPH